MIRQLNSLKSRFPNAEYSFERGKIITWKAILQPSPLSNQYQVKMIYERGKYPKAFVLDPKPLKLFKGEILLPHVYSTKEQQLCLFYPDGKEWHGGKLLIRTIIPWISEWLYFYELWLSCGIWLGGGTVHKKKKDDSESKTLDKQIELSETPPL